MIDTHAIRNKIISLALCGKLTEQLEEDGLAENLYQTIQAEKQLLVKNGIIKKEKALPAINEKDIPFCIPSSWIWVRWGDLSYQIQYGYNAPAKKTGRIKMVRITDIQGNKVIWDSVPFCDIEEENIPNFLLKPNNILFARTGGTVGKSYLVENIDENAVFAGYLIRTSFSEHLNAKYIKYFMQSRLYWKQLRNGTIATAQPNCNAKTLSKMMIPIPPAEEQQRIVDRIEQAFSVLENIDELQLDLSNNINTLKGLLFDAAIRGKLSEHLNTDSDIRTYLIERNISTVTNEDALPDNWCSALLKNVCNLCTGTSINEKVKKDNYLGYEGGLPYIGTKDVGFDKVIDYDNGVRIPFNEPGFVVAERSSVLLCIEGGSAGRKIAITNQDVCYGNKLCKFHSDFINPRYIYYFLQSPSFKKNFRNEITGLIDGVGINKLRAVVIPIPPVEEQQRIVDRIDELLPMFEG